MMYSIFRSGQIVKRKSHMTFKYVRHNCQLYNSFSKYRICRSSVLPTYLFTNCTHSVINTAKVSLASSCDLLPLKYDSYRNNHYLLYNSNSICRDRFFHSSSLSYSESKPSSKIEETVHALKEKSKSQEIVAPLDHKTKEVVVKKSLKQKITDECVHYYHGFRLLFIDIKVSANLLWRILRGKHLSRRERNLLVRTVSDMFRLVPFSVFIVVPFMEFLLPVFIKFFPGMLPSTFQTATDEDNKFKKSLKVKLEMAKFLQETLDNMTLKGSGHSSKTAKEFAEFFVKVRSAGGLCNSEEIMKFSKLFEDEITLDSLARPQLIALCRVLELRPIGTTNFLRFQLRMKLRTLAADDVVIQKEGIDTLTLAEMQQACRARGMRALGLSGERLKFQLSQWLDLHLNQKVPPSLLLLSRAFMLPETIPTTDKLKATISALPETVGVSTKAAIGEREGKVDHKTKIEIIKEEERKIREERIEIAEEERIVEERAKEKRRQDAEILVDPASISVDNAIDLEPEGLSVSTVKTKKSTADVKKKLEVDEVSSEEMQTIQDAIEALASEKKSFQVEKEELEELTEELEEYREDVEDLKEAIDASSDVADSKIKESKAAKRLFKKVNSMISSMNEVVVKLEKKEEIIKERIPDAKSSESEELLRIDELIGAIRKIQKIPDESKLEKIEQVLSKIDEDHDGSIRIDTVLKVIDELDEGNVKLSSSQIEELVDLLEKEAAIEEEEEIEKAKSKNAAKRVESTEEKKSKSEDKLKIPSVSPETEKILPPENDVSKSKSKTL